MRKTWDELSQPYRSRLERGGITRSDYQSGASLSAARGHERTPERPERAYTSQARYKDYLDRRAELEREVIEKKKDLFGSHPKFSNRRSAKGIHEGPMTGKPAKMAYMQRFIDSSFDELYDTIDWGDNEWGFLYYH